MLGQGFLNRGLLAAVVGLAPIGGASAWAFDVARGEPSETTVAPPNAYQDHALADGVVSREEYDGAIANAVACMRSVGLDARPAPGGVETFGDATDEQIAAGKSCVTRHAERLSFEWALQNQPADAEREAAAADATRCFRAGGGIIDGDVLTRSEILESLAHGDETQASALGSYLEANMQKYGFGF